MNKFLFELWNDSTKTIRLLALDFYAVIVDSGFARPHQLSPHRNLDLVIKLLIITTIWELHKVTHILSNDSIPYYHI